MAITGQSWRGGSRSLRVIASSKISVSAPRLIRRKLNQKGGIHSSPIFMKGQLIPHTAMTRVNRP